MKVLLSSIERYCRNGDDNYAYFFDVLIDSNTRNAVVFSHLESSYLCGIENDTRKI